MKYPNLKKIYILIIAIENLILNLNLNFIVNKILFLFDYNFFINLKNL